MPVLAEGWAPPGEDILSDADLPAAEREIHRLWQEFNRLYEADSISLEDDHERFRIRDEAIELTELALQAPVSTRQGAFAMLRILRQHAELELFEAGELCAPAMDRVLAVLEGTGKPGPQHWRF
jgi:hypothetical protein